jgi:HAD superfamily phosphoserine phosphatase-like hydrolase
MDMNRTKIALFDIDKTIYDGYLIMPLTEYFFEKHIVGRDFVDNLYQDLYLYQSGQVDYETSVENFNIHTASGLKNRSLDLFLKATAAFLETKEGGNFFSFAEPLIKLLKNNGNIYLITGEMQFVGKAVADYFSVNGYISSELEVENGLFTGNIKKSLAKREAKRDSMEDLFAAYSQEGSLAFGDSEGDIEMLNMVSEAFCINATEGLMEVALSKGWHIVTPSSILEEVKKVL